MNMFTYSSHCNKQGNLIEVVGHTLKNGQKLHQVAFDNKTWETAGWASHISLKASKVDETWVGKISRVFVIDAEEEVEGECGDHGSKELQTKKNMKKLIKHHCSV